MASRRWSRVASVAPVVATALVLTGLAITHEGFATTELDLNDSGVWVTNWQLKQVGRFNYEAGRLDASLTPGTMTHFDVLQDGPQVAVRDTAAGQLTVVDPTLARAGGPLEVSAKASVSLSGGQVEAANQAVLTDAGQAWVIPGESLANFNAEAFPPVLSELGENAQAVVDTAGRAQVADPVAGQIVVLDDTGSVVKEYSLSGLSPEATIQLTTVGLTPVVWSVDDARLWVGEDVVEVPPAAQLPSATPTGQGDEAEAETGFSVALPWPAEAANEVVYATSAGLVHQPLNGGEPTVLAVSADGQLVAEGDGSVPVALSGRPARPAQVGGCAYAAWSATSAFVRDCAGENQDLSQSVPQANSNDELVFRINWGHVLLNQVDSGGVWLVTDDLTKVDDWPEVLPNPDDGGEEDETREETEKEAEIERTEVNHPPVAEDDAFGARPGQSVLLPVVENDVDEDGDLLTVELSGAVPVNTSIGRVYNNSIFQLDVAAEASGSITFPYTVSDGRGGEDLGQVTVEVVPPGSNRPPQPVRQPEPIQVASGQQVEYNLLVDWRDPD
ncbi:MAG: hypothetical protein LBL92_04495, partial [Propionibacteriaceae bacterium]|nr:hypothetical protein [Propionibacteriaceae bacterium]